MPVLAHRRVTFSGVFGTTTNPYERWSLRLNLAPGGGSAISQAMVTSFGTAFAVHLIPIMRPAAVFTECKLADISAGTADSPGGLYTGNPFILGTGNQGTGSGGADYPPQISLAISLNTALRGPRGKGRFYLPAPALPYDPLTGTIPTSAMSGLQTAVTGFLNAVNAVDGAFSNIAIVSSFGVSSAVTSYRVGRVFDTIRSRRTSIPEVYTANLAVAA
jgi:hypothetical protein